MFRYVSSNHECALLVKHVVVFATSCRSGRAITFFTEADMGMLRSIANVVKLSGLDCLSCIGSNRVHLLDQLWHQFLRLSKKQGYITYA